MSQGISIRLNGKNREISHELTLSQLLLELQVREQAVAVELNRRIIERGQYPNTIIRGGDQLEIVHFVGGGSQ
jgi:thiamine biosynthesis protein ThiS